MVLIISATLSIETFELLRGYLHKIEFDNRYVIPFFNMADRRLTLQIDIIA